MPIRAIVVLLLIAPAGMFVCHAVVYRVARAFDRKPTAHSSALGAIAVWFAATMIAAAVLVWRANGSAGLTLCAAAYVAATYVALSILYLDVVNIAETSLHMHVLLEVLWSERPSLAGLVARYGAEHMIAERLERLTALGQVRSTDDRFYLADRSALRLNRAVDAWRTVLGLPTSPTEVTAVSSTRGGGAPRA